MEKHCPYVERCGFFANYGRRSSRTWKNLVALYCQGGLCRCCILYRRYTEGGSHLEEDLLPTGEPVPLPFHALP